MPACKSIGSFPAPLRRVPVFQSLKLAGIAAVFAAVTGCGTMMPGDSYQMSKDMLDMKTSLNKMGEDQAASSRKTDYSLTTLNDTLSKRNDALTANMDDIAKRITAQGADMDAMRKKVEELSFALDSLKKQLAMGGSTGMPATGTGIGTGTGMTTTPDPATGMGTGLSNANVTPMATPAPVQAMTVDQLFATGLKQVNTQQYKDARQTLQQALDQKPGDPDKALEIRFWLGEACLNDTPKDLDAAEDNYKQVITSNPSHLKAWVSLERMADIEQAKGDNPKALNWYKQIPANNPNYPDIARVKDKIAKLELSIGAGK